MMRAETNTEKLWFPPSGDVEKYIQQQENETQRKKEDIN